LLYYDEFFSKNDIVRHEWIETLKLADAEHQSYQHIRFKNPRPTVQIRRLSFKYLRKTGADMIRRIAGKEVAEIYLAHQDMTMARAYTNPDFKRLAKALRKMREQLVPVLGPPPVPPVQ